MPLVRENKTMRKQNQQDALEIGLIRSLFEARGPAVIMTTCFLLGDDLAAWQTCDPILVLLFIAGAVTSAGSIEGNAIRLSTCVGYVVSDDGLECRRRSALHQQTLARRRHPLVTDLQRGAAPSRLTFTRPCYKGRCLPGRRAFAALIV